ncbi:MAG: transposase [Chlamydiae bacterium]|nr:transposase [Chlamydiota bacterium]
MKRTKHSAEFKAKIALEAAKENHTLAELASKYKIHTVQISKWKQELLARSHLAFVSGKKEDNKQKALDTAYKYIGKLLVELDWIKKKLKE